MWDGGRERERKHGGGGGSRTIPRGSRTLPRDAIFHDAIFHDAISRDVISCDVISRVPSPRNALLIPADPSPTVRRWRQLSVRVSLLEPAFCIYWRLLRVKLQRVNCQARCQIQNSCGIEQISTLVLYWVYVDYPMVLYQLDVLKWQWTDIIVTLVYRPIVGFYI